MLGKPGQPISLEDIKRGLDAEKAREAIAMREKELGPAAIKLWKLLDDIDTLDDACKSDDAAFREAARTIQRKRFGIIDGAEFDNWSRQFNETSEQ